MWNRNNVQVELLREDFHFLHVKVTLDIVPSWFLTVIYASPKDGERGATLEQLRNLADSIQLPWLVIGDFNVIATPTEQKGGAPPDFNKCHEFFD